MCVCHKELVVAVLMQTHSLTIAGRMSSLLRHDDTLQYQISTQLTTVTSL